MNSSSESVGVVISDLHLLAARSVGVRRLTEVAPLLRDADLLVLNGDTFDFKWSTLPSLEDSVREAMVIVRDVLERYPRLTVHYVLGNHDWCGPFLDELRPLTDAGRVLLHPQLLRLGDKLFVHGDVCNRPMRQSDLDAYRARYLTPRPLGTFTKLLGGFIVASGLHFFAYVSHPKRTSADRILHYMELDHPEALVGVREIFFGHTHYPFEDFEYRGYKWHNTGSAIRALGFKPRRFVLNDAGATTP